MNADDHTRAHLLERQSEILATRKAGEDAQAMANLEQFARLNRHQRRAYATLTRRKIREQNREKALHHHEDREVPERVEGAPRPDGK